MKLELANLQSVRDFVANLKAFKSARPLNSLICNAAVYKPTDPEPAWTDDGFEMSMVSLKHLYNCNKHPHLFKPNVLISLVIRELTILATSFSSIFSLVT
jgi:hypothetical protein